MARSKSKLIYIHRSQFKHFLFNPNKRNLRTQQIYNLLLDPKTSIRPFFLLWKRNANVTNRFLNNKVAIYNGRFFLINDLKLIMKGFKFGELSGSRKKTNHKGKLRQKKKVIKKSQEEKLRKYTDVTYIKQTTNKKKR